MPSLKQITCQLERAASQAPLKEYSTSYGDGIVETFVSIPEDNGVFSIHLTSNGYIAPGLAVFVYIDGVYQCNRNRVGLITPDGTVTPDFYEVDFRFRQKEEKIASGGRFIGRTWRFEDLKIDTTPNVDDTILSNLGIIEVVVLRCHRTSEAVKPMIFGTPNGKKSKSGESTKKKKVVFKAKPNQPFPFEGLDGANDNLELENFGAAIDGTNDHRRDKHGDRDHLSRHRHHRTTSSNPSSTSDYGISFPDYLRWKATQIEAAANASGEQDDSSRGYYTEYRPNGRQDSGRRRYRVGDGISPSRLRCHQVFESSNGSLDELGELGEQPRRHKHRTSHTSRGRMQSVSDESSGSSTEVEETRRSHSSKGKQGASSGSAVDITTVPGTKPIHKVSKRHVHFQDGGYPGESVSSHHDELAIIDSRGQEPPSYNSHSSSFRRNEPDPSLASSIRPNPRYNPRYPPEAATPPPNPLYGTFNDHYGISKMPGGWAGFDPYDIVATPRLNPFATPFVNREPFALFSGPTNQVPKASNWGATVGDASGHGNGWGASTNNTNAQGTGWSESGIENGGQSSSWNMSGDANNLSSGEGAQGWGNTNGSGNANWGNSGGAQQDTNATFGNWSGSNYGNASNDVGNSNWGNTANANKTEWNNDTSGAQANENADNEPAAAWPGDNQRPAVQDDNKWDLPADNTAQQNTNNFQAPAENAAWQNTSSWNFPANDTHQQNAGSGNAVQAHTPPAAATNDAPRKTSKVGSKAASISSSSFIHKPSIPEQPYVKGYWSKFDMKPHTTPRKLQPGTNLIGDDGSEACAPSEAPYFVPEETVREKGVKQYVHAGKGYDYMHVTRHPEYLDSFKQPYAVFRFKYRSKEMLGQILGKSGKEQIARDAKKDQKEETKRRLAVLSKDQLIEHIVSETGKDSGSQKSGSKKGKSPMIPFPPAPLSMKSEPKSEPVQQWITNVANANAQSDDSDGPVTCNKCSNNLVGEWWHCDICSDFDICCLCASDNRRCSHELTKWKDGQDTFEGQPAPGPTGEKLPVILNGSGNGASNKGGSKKGGSNADGSKASEPLNTWGDNNSAWNGGDPGAVGNTDGTNWAFAGTTTTNGATGGEWGAFDSSGNWK